MQKLGVALVALGIGLSAIGIAACVGENTTLAQGTLNGPCFSDNTCNPGLSCSLVGGTATCVLKDSGSTNDSGGGNDSGVADTGTDGPRICAFQSTTYPCGGANPPNACYGQAQSCTLTGCSGQTDIRWECFSPNQCSSAACCVSPNDAVLTGTKNCSQGALQMLAVDGGGGVNGAKCALGNSCGSGDVQLCQANSQCPSGKVCSPVKITNGGASAAGVIVGACVPE